MRDRVNAFIAGLGSKWVLIVRVMSERSLRRKWENFRFVVFVDLYKKLGGQCEALARHAIRGAPVFGCGAMNLSSSARGQRCPF